MKQNVILNKIHSLYRSRFEPSNTLAMHLNGSLFEKWNDCVNEIAAEFRSQGLEDSAKEAEKWIEKRF